MSEKNCANCKHWDPFRIPKAGVCNERPNDRIQTEKDFHCPFFKPKEAEPCR